MSGQINEKYRKALEDAGSIVVGAYTCGIRGDELCARALDKLAEHGIKVAIGRRSATVRITSLDTDGSFMMCLQGTEMGEIVEVKLVPRRVA